MAFLGNYEHILRYWMLIFMFIVVAYLISLFTELIHKTLTGKVVDPNPRHYVKKTLVHHFMNTVSLSVDIYAITFFSFKDLDD